MKREALLERGYEMWFGLKYCLLTLAGFAAFALFLYLAAGRDLGRSYGEAIYTIYNLKVNILSLMLASVYSVVILVLTVVFTALVSIFFSHKIAGPLFRLARDLERLASGDITGKTFFREKDQFAMLATEKNNMAGRLAGLVSDSARDFAFLRETCSELSQKVSAMGSAGANEEEIRARLKELKRRAERIRTRVRDLKTTGE